MTDALAPTADAAAIARAVKARHVSAAEVIDAALARIAGAEPRLNAFTAIAADRARGRASALDKARKNGSTAGPLEGVPFCVKCMIDVEGLTTTAGSRLHAKDPPAIADAPVVEALERAGAVCIGATNMDEFGLGGTTENAFFGPTRNPHARDRVPGGSSGGSAAAVAAGMVPLSLGVDGLGSTRLPAALCGVFGLRPTVGTIAGESFEKSGIVAMTGPIARTVDDIALAFRALSGLVGDHHGDRTSSLRIARAGGPYFQDLGAGAGEVLGTACDALEVTDEVRFPEPERARAAALVVGGAEAGQRQLDNLRQHLHLLDPMTRDRLLAGAIVPAAWYIASRGFLAEHRRAVQALFRDIDLLIMPAVPVEAPPIGTRSICVAGHDELTGPALGYFTQPVATTGCPALAVPMRRQGKLPMGVQLVAAPGCEANLFLAAARLVTSGVAVSNVAAA